MVQGDTYKLAVPDPWLGYARGRDERKVSISIMPLVALRRNRIDMALKLSRGTLWRVTAGDRAHHSGAD